MKRLALILVLAASAACASDPTEPFPTLIIATASLPDAAPGVVYTASLEATGGVPGYTWSLAGGSLPVGLTLNSETGTIAGIPYGTTATFAVLVSSEDGQAARKDLIISVNAALVMSTEALPNAVWGAAYDQALAATGGKGGYTWSVTAGGFPEGLSLSPAGAISGTPAGPTRSFRVQVRSGDGQTAQRTLRLGVDIRFQSVSTGWLFSCGVATTGDAFCWGDNSNGELGDGTFTNRDVPTLVAGGHSFKSVSADYQHACGVTEAGAGYCWGWNTTGALGDGTYTGSNVPVAVVGDLSFQSVDAGGGHSCGVTPAGAAYCWGRNFDGELGAGLNTGVIVTGPVPVAGGLTFQSVTAAVSRTCGLTPAGAGYCWGRGASDVPVPLPDELTLQSIGVAAGQACMVTTAAIAYCWGDNTTGGLGDGTNVSSVVPVLVSGGLAFESVSVGYHSCGLVTTGAAYCWGTNQFGELGTGTNVESNVPVPVSGGLTFQSVSPGIYHTCGLTTTGAAYCWGRGDLGQLGSGPTNGSKVPAPVRYP